jgi:ferredoxin
MHRRLLGSGEELNVNSALDRRGFLRAFLHRAREANGEPLVATVDDSLCVAASGSDCRLCLVACPLGERAISFADGGPSILQACDGCGACVRACGVAAVPAAIRLIPRNVLDSAN